jgi:hypothetical protein
MEYARLINGLAACMGNEARTFTRYNKPAVQGEGDESHMTARDCKMVVIDYKGSDTSFNLRAGQIAFNETKLTAQMAFDTIAKNDSTLKRMSSLDMVATFSGLNAKYTPVLHDLLSLSRCYIDKLEPNKIMFGVFISGDGTPGVSIFVECEKEVVILTLKE